MNSQRGDVLKARFPHASGERGKKRPVVVTRDCLISGYLLTLMSEDRLQERIGRLSAEMISKLDVCLKAALGLG